MDGADDCCVGIDDISGAPRVTQGVETSVVGPTDDAHGLAGEQSPYVGLCGAFEHWCLGHDGARRLVVAEISVPRNGEGRAETEDDDADSQGDPADGDDVEQTQAMTARAWSGLPEELGYLSCQLVRGESLGALPGISVVTHRQDLGTE